MKTKLALLAVPVVALACSDAEQATPLEPPAISRADVIIQAAPDVGQYLHSVTPNIEKCFDFRYRVVPNTNITLKATVQFPNNDPATKGTVVWQRCVKEKNPVQLGHCVIGVQGAKWTTISRMRVDGTGSAEQVISVPINARHGFRYKYIGQGSGVKNGFSDGIDVQALNC